MKAIRAHEFGEPDVLQMDDIPVPTPQSDELLIKVYATSVNPVDWKILSGNYQKFPVNLPLTPGWDVSGVVEKRAPMYRILNRAMKFTVAPIRPKMAPLPNISSSKQTSSRLNRKVSIMCTPRLYP